MINLHSAGTGLDGYPMLCAQLESLLADERDFIANSELVVPLVKDGKLVGVLDLDSPSLARFTLQDQADIEQLAAIFLRLTDC